MQARRSDLAAETGATAAMTNSVDRDAVTARVRESGPLDLLAVSGGVGDPLEPDPDGVDRLICINVNAPYHAAVKAARRMPEGDCVIVIGSVDGDSIPFTGLSAYTMSKAALQGMGRRPAWDFGLRWITVNVVQPGPRYGPEPGGRADEGHEYRSENNPSRVPQSGSSPKARA